MNYKNPITQLLAFCIIVATFLVLLVICGPDIVNMITAIQSELHHRITAALEQ